MAKPIALQRRIKLGVMNDQVAIPAQIMKLPIMPIRRDIIVSNGKLSVATEKSAATE